jgi:hypothetical protein
MPHGAHVKIDISGFKMKQTKQRVIAIDYFRGFCLLVVLINHAIAFSMPFALWTGAGGLWTSAAEMFLLLSGVTYGIVRGDRILSDFKPILRKTWRRALIIYLVNIFIVFATLIISLLLTSHNLISDVNGTVPASSPGTLILNIITFRYTIGWADFLMYYSVFLIAAPGLLYLIKRRFWPVPVILSVLLFSAYYAHLIPHGNYGTFALWQIYFVLGLVIGRFRPQLLRAVSVMPKLRLKLISYSVVSLAGLMMIFSYLVEHSIYPTVSRLADEGWLPVKAQAAYIRLLNIRSSVDRFLLDGRAGLLRPAVSLLIAAAVYIVYRRYGANILEKTGRFFIGLGQDSLVIFAAHALAIPLIAALPITHGPLINNLALTSLLVASMWLVSIRRQLGFRLTAYWLELKASYSQAKYAYLQQYEDGN